ncbi:MAG: class I SAM-dependent methyltransferase [Chitinophagales bacterium]
MNYKLLFPTYRTRYLFLKNTLDALTANGQNRFQHILHLGTGEGDYDQMIAEYGEKVTACDINEADIVYAQQLNANVDNLTYRIEDAQNLSFEDVAFDLVISIDVIEHVPDSAKMMQEIGRVLQPNAKAVVSFPSIDFPFTYDPVNRLLNLFRQKIPIGAYAYGHFKLIDSKKFKQWSAENQLNIEAERYLTQYFAALPELYWPGFLQKLLKANTQNASVKEADKSLKLRPSTKNPPLLFLTDALIAVDKLLFGWSKASVGKGFVLQKKGDTK